jgi:RNA-splicing ligase RtcB
MAQVVGMHTTRYVVERSSIRAHATSLGLEVNCTGPDLLIEEQPAAYRNNQCVIEDTEDYSIGKGAVAFQPIVTYKVRDGLMNSGDRF